MPHPINQNHPLLNNCVHSQFKHKESITIKFVNKHYPASTTSTNFTLNSLEPFQVTYSTQSNSLTQYSTKTTVMKECAGFRSHRSANSLGETSSIGAFSRKTSHTPLAMEQHCASSKRTTQKSSSKIASPFVPFATTKV